MKSGDRISAGWWKLVLVFPVWLISQLYGAQAGAQPAAQADAIDQYVRSEMQQEGIPGLALGLYERGKTIRAEGFGLANVELNVSVQPQTLFNSGSLAKQFTATAVMMLVEEGKIRLDDSVTKYFPNAPASWKAVEVQHLLSHTSGLGDFSTQKLTGRNAPFDFRQDFTEEELRKKLYALPVVFAPGTDWAYCNTNYVLLGMLIESVTGQTWADFLAHRIFQPLGMTSARVTDEKAIVLNRGAGYLLNKGRLENQEWSAQTWNSIADGSLYLNVIDLAKWDEALLTAKLLKRATLDRMWSVFPLRNGKPNSGDYGFGFIIRSINGHRLIEHEGWWQGFHNYWGLYVDDGVGVVVLTNLAYPHSQPQDIGNVVAGLYKSVLMPADILPTTDAHPEITAHIRKALEQLIEGKVNVADYTSEMGADMKGAQDLQGYLKALGPISSFDLVGQSERDGQREFRFRVRMAERILTFTFLLDKDGRIAHMSFSG